MRTSTGPLRYVFFNLKGHPRGNAVLRDCIRGGFLPQLVVEEASSLAQRNVQAISTAFGSHHAFGDHYPSLQRALDGATIRCEQVGNLNDQACLALVRELQPDYILLGDTRILRSAMIRSVRRGIVNVHPGYLPVVRGNTPYVWAAHLGLPQGCTSHFIDEGIDTGPVLLRATVDANAVATYTDLLFRLADLCARLAVDTLRGLVDGSIAPVAQDRLALNETHTPATYMKAPDWMVRSVRRNWSVLRDRTPGGAGGRVPRVRADTAGHKRSGG